MKQSIKRAGLYAVAGAVGVLLAHACTTDTIQPVVPPGVLGLCAYPRGCYTVESSGPTQGQCDDCRGGLWRCRVVYSGPQMTAERAPDGGTWTHVDDGTSSPSDQPSVCEFYPATPSGRQTLCAPVESLCIGRGPACPATGACVRSGASCQTGLTVPPQRRPQDPSGQTYCPYTDDTCCMPTADLGGPDGGDGGIGDAGGVLDAALAARPG